MKKTLKYRIPLLAAASLGYLASDTNPGHKKKYDQDTQPQIESSSSANSVIVANPERPFLANTTFNKKVIEVATADFRKMRLQDWFWNANVPFDEETKTPFEQATEAFEKSNLSDFLKVRGPFLFFQESGYDPTKVSKPNAAGIAQLKPDTARDYGLTVSEKEDERFNPQRSTEAAIKHLKICKQTIARSSAFRQIKDALPQLQSDDDFLDLLTINAYNAGQSRIIAGLDYFLKKWSAHSFELFPGTSARELFAIFTEFSEKSSDNLLNGYSKEAAEYSYKITALYELHKMYTPNNNSENMRRQKELGIYYAIAEDQAEKKTSYQEQDWQIEKIRGAAQVDFWKTEIDTKNPYQNFEKVRMLADAHYHLGKAFRDGKSQKYLWKDGTRNIEEYKIHWQLAAQNYQKLLQVLQPKEKARFAYLQNRAEEIESELFQ